MSGSSWAHICVMVGLFSRVGGWRTGLKYCLQRLHLWEKYKKTLDNLKYSEVSLNSSHTISRAAKDGQDQLAQPPTYHQCVSCSPNPAFPCMPWGALSASGWGPRKPEVLLHSDIWESGGDTSSTVNSSQKLFLFV